MIRRKMQKIGGTRISPAVFLLLAFVVGVMMFGCSGPRTYIHSSPGLDAIRLIVVMPFENLSGDDSAADRVRSGFVIELLKTGAFDVMDVGEADRLLKLASLSYDVTKMPTPVLGIVGGEAPDDRTSVPLSKRIGDALKVQAIIVGSVDTFSSEKSRDETVPEVTITARLIDVETGIIIWASNHTGRGSAGIPIVGWGKRVSRSLVLRGVIADMAGELAQYVP